jgi:hypothetical protein
MEASKHNKKKAKTKKKKKKGRIKMKRAEDKNVRQCR